jgi:hypothetical protein
MTNKFKSIESLIRGIVDESYRDEIRKRTIKVHGETGLSDGAQRNANIAARNEQERNKRKEARKHETAHREYEAARRHREGSVREETQEKSNSGTESRIKIKNVARINDSLPTSPKSTLSRTAEITSKIIEGNGLMYSDNKFGLSASLINAARAIVEGDAEKVEKKADKKEVGEFKKDPGDVRKMKGGNTKVNLEPEMNMKNVEEAKIRTSLPKGEHAVRVDSETKYDMNPHGTKPQDPRDKGLPRRAMLKTKPKGSIPEDFVEEEIELIREVKFEHHMPFRKYIDHYSNAKKYSDDDLKSMHKRWIADHTNLRSNPDTSEKLLAVHHVLKQRGHPVGDLPKHPNLGMTMYNEEKESVENMEEGFARPYEHYGTHTGTHSGAIEHVINHMKKLGWEHSGTNRHSDKLSTAEFGHKSGAKAFATISNVGREPNEHGYDIHSSAFGPKKAVREENVSHVLSPKQMKIARIAGNPNKIDAKDLATLRATKNKKLDEEKIEHFRNGSRHVIAEPSPADPDHMLLTYREKNQDVAYGKAHRRHYKEKANEFIKTGELRD